MVHPYKKEGVTGHNDKLRRMTRDYGDANPSMKKLAPDNRMKKEGPEEAVGFGVDSAAPKARGDKPARKTTAANPVATYNTGGRVRNTGGGVIARARGGAAKKPSTHVNIIVAPQGPQGPTPNPALAGGVAPPGMPPKPPMGPPGLAGAPGMGAGMPPGAMPPGGLPPGAIPPRKRGGKVEHGDEAADEALFKKMMKGHPDKTEDKALVREMVKPGALKGRARGGTVHVGLTGGAESGPGRLEKTEARSRRKSADKDADLIR